MKIKTLILILITSIRICSAQNIGIGNLAPDSSALLDITSNNKGVLVPRLSLAQINTIPFPANSLLVYQTDNISGFYYNSGTSTDPVWKRVGDEPSFTGHLVDFFGLNNTFTVPNNVYRIYFEIVSGGGGGGGTFYNSPSTINGGGGGGGGGFASGYIIVTPGEVLTISVGFGGVSGTNGNPASNGIDGEKSTIESNGTTILGLTGGKGGQAGTLLSTGDGGLGGKIVSIDNSKVKLRCNDISSISGLRGSVGINSSFSYTGEGGVVHNIGTYNVNEFYTRTLDIGINLTLLKPTFGKGGDYSSASRGYAKFYW